MRMYHINTFTGVQQCRDAIQSIWASSCTWEVFKLELHSLDKYYTVHWALDCPSDLHKLTFLSDQIHYRVSYTCTWTSAVNKRRFPSKDIHYTTFYTYLLCSPTGVSTKVHSVRNLLRTDTDISCEHNCVHRVESCLCMCMDFIRVLKRATNLGLILERLHSRELRPGSSVFVFRPDLWLLLDMKMQVIPQRI